MVLSDKVVSSNGRMAISQYQLVPIIILDRDTPPTSVRGNCFVMDIPPIYIFILFKCSSDTYCKNYIL